MDAEPGEDGWPTVPGPPGPQGGSGVVGPAGPAVYLDAEPGEDGWPTVPGIPGPQGTTGAIGPVGPAVFLEAEPGEDGLGTILITPTILVPVVNLLINGGMDLFQRTDPAVATACSDDTYGPDRWVVLTQTASVNAQRSTGNVAKNACKLTQNQASAQRLGLLQIVESADSLPLRSRAMRFQCSVKISNSQAVRIALLEWTGTADGVTSDVVLSWTSSTYTANNFFLAASLTVTAVTSLTPSAATWTKLSLSSTISASCNNLIVFIWTEGTAAQNVTLEVTEAGLYDGSADQPWLSRLQAQEVAIAQRYYEKSCSIDVPATKSANSEYITAFVTDPVPSFAIFANVGYQTRKRGTPTVTVHPYNTGTDTSKVTIAGGTDQAADSGVPIALGSHHFAVQNQSGGALTVPNQSLIFHFEAESEL